ncbi:glycoside hydrolase family 3 protein [Rhodothermus marinus]|uniref:glycoside hydrolase family 3 protein n=1 Tax=Rhodothermus marinus TaxID=29549 RepID=UPI0037C95597
MKHLVTTLLFGLVITAAVQAQSSRVDSLLAAMTLAEKISLLHGAIDPTGEAGAGYVPGVPRLGIPAMRLTDGPAGIRTRHPATALPAPVALASSFDPELAYRYGHVMGIEGRARRHEVLLAPMVNIVRVPEAGRNFETFSEDPLLSAEMVAAEVRGIQEAGMMATVKHYVVNNFENDRMRVNVVVDERTLREIYLPGFEAAIRAGVASVMCAYNRVNGPYACDNETLLTDILRDEWGFEGWVMTDWFAGHSLESLVRGLDQEMPGYTIPFSSPDMPLAPAVFADSLLAAVESGRIDEAYVDRAVRRILVQMERFGLLDGEATPPEIDIEAHAAVAREVAEAGAVLLRNENQTLPLTARDLQHLVVIGPTATRPLIGGGGSSRVRPFRTTSTLAALQELAGSQAQIRYVPGIDLDGVPVPTAALRTPDGQPGLLRQGADGATQVDSLIDFTGERALPPGSQWTWTGTLTAPTAGVYELKLQTAGGVGTLSIDGQPVLRTGMFFSDASLIPTADSLENATYRVELQAGQQLSLTVQISGQVPSLPFLPAGQNPVQVRLAWVTPERRAAFLEEAAEAARAAHAAVVFVYEEGTEGRDRETLALHPDQDALVEAVAAANPRTTVVMNVGAPTLMPWAERVGAILLMWYPGQEGGWATADVLLGRANPAGRLPVTFPRRAEDAPTASPERYPGVELTARYDEGIFVGYRWYDAQQIEPLFPFGHGLSYTTFTYENLRVEPDGDGFVVRFVVRNTGERAGSDAPQVYMGPPENPPVPMAVRQLVGFRRVTLAPGEAQEVTVRIDGRALSYWSVEDHAWVKATGRRPLYVGASSRDLRLQTEIDVR